MIILFHKPYGVLSQFTPEHGSKWTTLADFGFPPHIYPVGRLDADSEGMLLLSDEKGQTGQLLHPEKGHPRTYLVQVEGIITEKACSLLEAGVTIQGYKTLPATVTRLLHEPTLEPRVPPIRHRLNVPTSWIELEITEGKNRQVRRMTAAVGFPTLRLLRIRIGGLVLGDLRSGQWRILTDRDRSLLRRHS